MRSSILLLSALTTLALATPIANPLSVLSLRPKDRHEHTISSCDLSQATPPSASTPLPAPAAGLSLAHVAIGRGIQNYTCATSTSSSTPAAIGAVATLYNASCLAASYPTVLSTLPSLALSMPTEKLVDNLNLAASGKHYFLNATTPTFNMGFLGLTQARKAASILAPVQTPAAVPWLKLEHTLLGAQGDLMEIYRLNTAGGSPPTTCEGMDPAFSVQYAAEYWFYAGTES